MIQAEQDKQRLADSQLAIQNLQAEVVALRTKPNIVKGKVVVVRHSPSFLVGLSLTPASPSGRERALGRKHMRDMLRRYVEAIYASHPFLFLLYQLFSY